jgi:addiction module HigA family antidote
MIEVPTDRPPTHPGEMLREEFLKPLKITQEELAGLIDMSFQTVNLLVNKHRDVTPNVALRLGRLFGVDPEFWLNLQARWDLYQQRQSAWPEIKTKVTPLRPLKDDPKIVPLRTRLPMVAERSTSSSYGGVRKSDAVHHETLPSASKTKKPTRPRRKPSQPRKKR